MVVTSLLWSGLSWLCLLGVALWLLVLLFPMPGSSDGTDFNDRWGDKPEKVVMPPKTYSELQQQKGSLDEEDIG